MDISGAFKASDPPMGYRFGVFFFAGGVIPNPLDIKFQKVSGLSAEVTTESLTEGGQNLFVHRMPKRMSYNNLVLERGMVNLSPLSIEFNLSMNLFKFYTSNVLIMLFGESGIPRSAWLLLKAYPVKWSYSDLDAQSNTVLMDKMELAYTRCETFRL